MSAPAPRPRRTSAFEPRFTIMIAYLAVFFFVYCLALVSPALLEIANQPVSGPEQQQLAHDAARQAISGKLWIALLAATATVALGIWARVLPGLRARR
jgi:ABC-type Fe3+ transport system permease subunit